MGKRVASDGSFIGELLRLEALSENSETRNASSILKIFDDKILTEAGVDLVKIRQVFNTEFFKGVLTYVLWFSSVYVSVCQLLGLSFFYKKSNPSSEIKQTVKVGQVAPSKRQLKKQQAEKEKNDNAPKSKTFVVD